MKYQIKSVSETLMTVAMVFLIIGASTVLILAMHQDKPERFPVPYLLPVSFYSGQINDFGTDKIQAINDLLSDAVIIDSFCEHIFQANMLF